MALKIDTSQRVRGPQARLHLVEAIRDAPASEPETDWVEWKSEADVRDKAWRGGVASHILGFANREPTRASRATEGHAYLVLGVEPGNVIGTAAYDPADIETWLNPYIGTANGPGWEPDYVRIDGVEVLILSVDPPPEGHGAFPLRKAFMSPSGTNHPQGEIFVRRNGKTVSEPTAAEMDMLNARAQKPQSGLDIGLRWSNEGPINPIELNDTAQQTWLDSERTVLLAPLSGSPVALGNLAQDAVTKMTNIFGRENRTEDDYRQQVDAYVAGARQELGNEVKAHAVAAGHGRIELEVINRCDQNFEDVLVEAYVEGNVCAYFDEDDASDESEFPSRPRRWGTPSPFRGFTPPIHMPNLSHLSRPPRGHIDNSASARIKFAEFHLRPGYKVPLPSVYLIVRDDHAGGELNIRWVATSRSTAGSVFGDLAVEISDKPVPLADLMDA